MDFSPLLVIFGALLAAAIPIGLLLRYADELARIVPFIRRFLPIVFLFTMAFGFFALPMSVQAADATAGTIDFDQDTTAEGTLLYVELKGLEASADYKLNWTTDDTGYSFTTGSNQNTFVVPIKVNKPSVGNVFIIYLRAQSAGTVLDQVTTIVTEADTVLDTDAFLAIAIPLIVMALVVSIIVGITARSRRRG